MNKILYIYEGTNNLEDKDYLISLEISKGNFSHVNEQLDLANYDVLIVDYNISKEIFNEVDFFNFITYIRLTHCKKDLPIFIYSSLSSKKLINFLKNDQTNISKTERFEFIYKEDFETELLTGKPKFLSLLKTIIQEPFNWQKFISIIEVKDKSTNNHSIANEWAIYRWTKTIEGVDTEIQEIENNLKKVEENLFFKYLRAKYPIQETKVTSKDLEIRGINDSKILYIDDEFEKGWFELMCTIFTEINDSTNFECLDINFRDYAQDEIVKLAIEKIQNQQSDIVILDFRLHKKDHSTRKISDITGLKILKKIKEINPGIQVIIFSATNKIWNLEAVQNAGADGFIIKESPQNSIDENFTEEIIFSFIKTLNNANERIFIKDIWKKTKKTQEKLTLDIKARKFNKDFIAEVNLNFNLAFESILTPTRNNNYDAPFIYYFLILELIANNLIIEEIKKSNNTTYYSYYLRTFEKYLKNHKGEKESEKRGLAYSLKFDNILKSYSVEHSKLNKLIKLRNEFIHPDPNKKVVKISRNNVLDIFEIVSNLLLNL